jgi:hypothetical protein
MNEQFSPNPTQPERRFGPFNNVDMRYAPLAAGAGAAAGAAGTPQRPPPLGLPFSETPIAGDGSQYVSSPTFEDSPPANLPSNSDRRRGRDDTFVFGDDMRTPVPLKRPRQEETMGEDTFNNALNNLNLATESVEEEKASEPWMGDDDLYGPVTEVDYPDMHEHDLNRFRPKVPPQPEERRDFNDRVQYGEYVPSGSEPDLVPGRRTQEELANMTPNQLRLELARARDLVQDAKADVEAPAVDGQADTTIVAGDLVPVSNPVKPQEAQKPDPWTSPDPFEYSFVQLTTPGGALNSLYETGIKVGLSSYGNYQSQLAAQRQLDYERSLAQPPPDPTLALPAPSERLALTMPGYGMEHQDANYSAPAGPEPRLSDRMGFPRLGFSMDPPESLLGRPGDTNVVGSSNPNNVMQDTHTIPLMGDAPLNRGPTYDLQNNNFLWDRGYGANDMLDYGDPLESIPY